MPHTELLPTDPTLHASDGQFQKGGLRAGMQMNVNARNENPKIGLGISSADHI